jgi:MFS family permease
MHALKKRYREFRNTLHLEAALSFTNLTLTTGVFLVGFALLLDASSLAIGILSAIPLLANLLQLVSGFILEATGTKKGTALWSLVLARLSWIPLILAAMWLRPSSWLVILLMAVLVASSLLTAVGNLALLSWIKDLVPTRKLAEFLGRRNMWAYGAGIVAYLGGSFAIDHLPGLRGYGFIFSFALVVGTIAAILLFRVPQRKRKVKAVSFQSFKERMLLPFRDVSFRPLLRFGIAWGFAVNIALPFWFVLMFDSLKLSFFVASLFLVADTVARMIGFSAWVPLVQRFGSRPILTINATIIAAYPFIFFFITPTHVWSIPVLWALAGFAAAGTELSTLRVLFKSAPRNLDAYYLASFTGMVGLATALGPVFGGAVITGLERYGTPLAGYEPVRYVFLVTFFARILVLPLIAAIDEPRARGVSDVLHRMKQLRFFSLFVGVYSFAYYTSKVVLFPQKQMFILQRKMARMLRRDTRKTLRLMERISQSLKSLTSGNMSYYRNRLEKLKADLGGMVDRTGYAESTIYHRAPARVLHRLELFLMMAKRSPVVKRSGSFRRPIAKDIEKLERVYQRNLDKNRLPK